MSDRFLQQQALMQAIQASSFDAYQQAPVGPPVSVYHLIEALVKEQGIAEGYEAAGIEVPKWLREKIAGLKRGVAARHREEMETALIAARREVEELCGRQEKLSDAQRKVRELEEKLGI